MTMTWLILGALTLGLFAVAMLLGAARGLAEREGSDLRLGEWHHAYLGALLYGVSWLAGGPVLRVVGLVLLTDDGVQHLVQAITGNLKWAGPIRRGYNWLYPRVPWLQRVNTWLDKIFGTNR